jgi:hypothetical protein
MKVLFTIVPRARSIQRLPFTLDDVADAMLFQGRQRAGRAGAHDAVSQHLLHLRGSDTSSGSVRVNMRGEKARRTMSEIIEYSDNVSLLRKYTLKS